MVVKSTTSLSMSKQCPRSLVCRTSTSTSMTATYGVVVSSDGTGISMYACTWKPALLSTLWASSTAMSYDRYREPTPTNKDSTRNLFIGPNWREHLRIMVCSSSCFVIFQVYSSLRWRWRPRLRQSHLCRRPATSCKFSAKARLMGSIAIRIFWAMRRRYG